jgi:hypothetical protein
MIALIEIVENGKIVENSRPINPLETRYCAYRL